MSFKKPLPTWKAQGIQPPEHKLEEGWKAQDKPPAGWLNWQANTTYEALQELQDNAVDHRDVTSEPSASGVVRLNEAGKLNEAVLAGAEHKEITLKPGVQIVESDQDTPFNVGSIKGRTLVNRLGRYGYFERNVGWGGWAGSLSFANNEMSIVSGGTKINPQATCLTIGDKPNVGDVFFVRVKAKTSSAKTKYLMTYFYNTITSIIDVGKVENPKVDKWYDIGGVIEVTQSMVDTWDQLGLKLVSYYISGTESDGTATFKEAALYLIPSSEKNLAIKELLVKYPFVNEITNVINPYAIAIGENLIPPLTIYGDRTTSVSVRLLSPYSIQIVGDSDVSSYKRFRTDSLPISPSTNLTLQFDYEGSGGIGYVECLDKNGDRIPDADTVATIENGRGFVTFQTPSNCWAVIVQFDNRRTANIVHTFKNPILTVGTESKPFKLQSHSMWAAECQLAANPDDGLNADELFTGNDGLPYVLEKWKKVVLDSKYTYGPSASANAIGFKIARAQQVDLKIADPLTFSSNFRGEQMTYSTKPTTTWTAPNIIRISPSMPGQSDTNVYLSISNTDSGWGDAYTPTADEIKAYFLGWKMYQEGSRETPYTNGKKQWFKISKPSDTSVDVIPMDSYPEYTPYRIQYLKATPTVESIRNYEQGLTLCAGSSVIKVGSGIVIREKSAPSKDYSGNWNLGNPVANSSAEGFNHKAHKVMTVYQNSSFDPRWEHVYTNEYGALAQLKPPYVLGQTAIYHVTYTMLDPTLSAPINGNVATNLRATVSDLVHDVGDIGRRLSVSEIRLNSISSDLNSPLEWITATLINGWNSVTGRSIQYAMDVFGFVHFRGTLDSSGASKAVGTDIFVLPSQFRPSRTIGVSTATYNSPQDIQPYAIDIGVGGNVRITMENTRRYVYLESFSFYVGGGEKI
ncbi:hypothetical protein [Paenibacillus aquistagni]|uniref:hypothetical protein n=1 Tax=Paenibacillus aquistagni TaxID=1852522 RepID=UPI00145B80C8|nr:hypothetical protein [Paenibacillus aquistagni]NMM53536.1 hypothetical protein [Paenibacillus aquistagni]